MSQLMQTNFEGGGGGALPLVIYHPDSEPGNTLNKPRILRCFS